MLRRDDGARGRFEERISSRRSISAGERADTQSVDLVSGTPRNQPPLPLRPVVAAVERLRASARLVVLIVLLLAPALFATWAFAGVIGGQIAFAASERAGLVVVRPALADLAATLQGEQVDLSALGAAVSAHPELQANDAMQAVKAAAQDPAATTTHGRAVTAAALAALIGQVGNTSQLVLDPDLDSFYVMDAQIFQMPKGLQAVAEAAAPGTGDKTARVALQAVQAGTVASVATTVAGDISTAVKSTAMPGLEGKLQPVGASVAALNAIAGSLTKSLSRPGPADSAEVRAVGAAVAQAVDPLTSAMDDLLAAREEPARAATHPDAACDRAGPRPRRLARRRCRVADPPRCRSHRARRQRHPGRRPTSLSPCRRAETSSVTSAGRQKPHETTCRTLLRVISAEVEHLKGASADLSEVSSDLAETARESETRSRAITDSVRGVSGEVQSVSAGTEQMGAAVHEIAGSASQAAGVAASAVRIGSSANETVSRLASSSQEISGVVDLIQAIAAQTNLLALNATIEAARAGEVGKGFAVVANEVKQLAGQTSQATQDIVARVQSIQDDVANTASAITEMTAITGEVNDYGASIAAAVEEQTAVTGDISRSLALAATATGEIAQSIDGVTEAVERTSRSAERTAVMARQVSEVSDTLRESLAQFTF